MKRKIVQQRMSWHLTWKRNKVEKICRQTPNAYDCMNLSTITRSHKPINTINTHVCDDQISNIEQYKQKHFYDYMNTTIWLLYLKHWPIQKTRMRDEKKG